MIDRGALAGQAGGAMALWLALYGAGVLGSGLAPTLLLDVREAARRGAHGWEAWQQWGPRCRSRAAARADRQRFADACGPAALCAALRQRGTRTTQELLWSMCRVRGGGTTLGRLAGAARRLGQPCETRFDGALDRLPVPAIVHLRRKHFVVLQRVDGARAEVLDPACGEIVLPLALLARQASGAVLVFPGDPAARGPLPAAGGGSR